jgi:hypothetical protein
LNLDSLIFDEWYILQQLQNSSLIFINGHVALI